MRFDISELGITELKKLGYSDADIHDFTYGYTARTNPDLIKTFETLGEAMNSKYCKMYIDIIPEGYTDDCWKVKKSEGTEKLELIDSMYKSINLEKENHLLKLENKKLKEENQKLKEENESIKNLSDEGVKILDNLVDLNTQVNQLIDTLLLQESKT